jgi:hypothetical protein
MDMEFRASCDTPLKRRFPMALIQGTKYANVLNGTALDDMFAGLGGDDTMSGGWGNDTAWYSGNLGGYAFSSVGGRLVVRDTIAADGSDGRDSLDQIETLQFGNSQLQITASEFRVNTYTHSNQDMPSITTLTDGGFVVSWSSSGQDGSNYGIYAQRYDVGGQAVGSEFRGNTYTEVGQRFSSITALADGGFVVSWMSSGQDGDGSGIYAQRYNAGGQAVGTEFRVNTYTTSNQQSSSITALGDGGFVVSWSSNGQDGSSNGIYAQLYDISGQAVGTEFRVNTYTTSNQYGSTNTALADGGFVVSWSSYGQDGDGGGIYAQRYNAGGQAVGTEFRINTYTTSNQETPSITALADGGFVVSWSSYDQDGSGYGIYAQRYNEGGQAVGGEFRVNTYTTDTQYLPSITALADGGFVVSWSSNGQDGSDYGIYAQRYNSGGQAVGSEFQVNTYTTSDQSYPSITALADGGFVVSWMSSGQDGSGDGIYAQRYDAQGDPVGLKLTGSGGADTINLDPGQLLTVDGAGGNDDVRGSSGDDVLLGGLGNDKLTGNAGNDYLDGGAGNDRMVGGLGDDDYYVDSIKDLLTEATGAGSDSVFSSVAWTLAANFENLTLTGGGNINGTGNAQGNLLNGNSGNNFLDGKAGADLMAGDSGDDSYVADNLFDYVSENDNAGVDTVKSSVSFTLGDYIENLTLTGSALNGIGNDEDNQILGNAGNNLLQGWDGQDNLTGLAGSDVLDGGDGADWLSGGMGLDTLTGGSGADTFYFDTNLSTGNADHVTDFIHASDKLHLKQSLVANAGGAGILGAGELFYGVAITGTETQHILYNSTTGALYYNANGAAAGGFTLIATLDNKPALTNTDIQLVG